MRNEGLSVIVGGSVILFTSVILGAAAVSASASPLSMLGAKQLPFGLPGLPLQSPATVIANVTSITGTLSVFGNAYLVVLYAACALTLAIFAAPL
ncbi:hypothetical protein HDU98_011933 [Podochytrium sp. JEL0797]|nr:hypothetical protein HDU98_011933 [Podochytrium sp. JEL0797]